MKKYVQYVIPIISFCFLGCLLVMFIFRMADRGELIGVASVEYPSEISIRTLNNGKFQEDFGKWMSDNFFGHTKIVKIHNQIEYGLFGDGSGDWIQGKDRYLYSKEQTFGYTGGARSNTTNAEEYEAYAQSIYTLQENLKKQGKEFFYLVNPTKAQIYPEKLPWYEKIIAGHYAEDADSAERCLIRAFEKYGVNYYDTTEDLIKMRSSVDYDVFASTGHHWTFTAAANELNKLFDSMSFRTPSILYPKINIEVSDEFYNTDKDILYLQNVVYPVSSRRYTLPVIEYSNVSNNAVYLFGTSYGWEIADSLYRSAGRYAFRNLTYQQYFTHLTRYNKDGIDQTLYTQDNQPSDLKIMQGIRDSDLVIMEQPGVLQVPETHKKFVDYVNSYIDKMSYKLGQNVMNVTADMAAVELRNFWGAEDWGQWSSDKECSLILHGEVLKMAANPLYLQLTASSYGQNQDVEVFLNNHSIATLSITPENRNYFVQLSADYIQDNENEISFVSNNALVSPLNLNQSDDNRKLGLGISSLYIDEVKN